MSSSNRPRDRSPKVLFLSAERRELEGSRLYRCVYQAKQLEKAGLEAQVVFFEDASKKQVANADVLIFSRCLHGKVTADLTRLARAQGKLLLGDLDDKIYAPWDVDATGYLRSKVTFGSDLRTRSRVIVTEYRILRLLPLLDELIVSTPGLRDSLRELGLSAHVARNAFDTDVAAPKERARPQLKRILVMSGTRTHDADLRMIAEPLARFLRESPELTCTFLGPLELPGCLRGLRNIARVELLPVNELYSSIVEFDLCLVPLEPTPFNDYKSALKFLECGLFSVPILASARREYRELVRDGENGLLAGDDAESWYVALCRLRDQPGLLNELARGAYRTTLADHTVTGRGTALADMLGRLYEAHLEQRKASRA